MNNGVHTHTRKKHEYAYIYVYEKKNGNIGNTTPMKPVFI